MADVTTKLVVGFVGVTPQILSVTGHAMSGTMIGKGIPGRKRWSAWQWSTLALLVSVLGTGLPQATAQTLGLAPNPYIYDDCGQIHGICCPGPLVWGFDPYGGCDHCPV